MPRVITKTVRYTGGDYTTLAGALAAVPANLVTADEQWDIQIAESAAGNYEWTFTGIDAYGIYISGFTTDATRFIRIKPYPGLGFADRSYSGPADYDPVKGIALKASNSVLRVQSQYTVIEGLQIKRNEKNSLNSGEYAIGNDGNGINSTIKNCIISSNFTGTTQVVYWVSSDIVNSLIISKGSHGIGSPKTISNSTIINLGSDVTIVGTRAGIFQEYGNATVKNSAIFGFDFVSTSSGAAFVSGSNNNATNLASGPTNWGSNSFTGLSTSTQFVDIAVTTATTGNFRLRKSSPLVRGGTRDVAYTGDLDIVGRSRSLTLPSIGAWEEPSAVGTVFPANIRFPIRDANGNPTSTSVDMGDMFLRKEQYLTAGLWAWGEGSSGGLGQGDTTSRSSPVQIGSLSSWRHVGPGASNVFAIKTDGTLWACGYNYNGQLGIGTVTDISSPVQVGSLTNWKQVYCNEGKQTAALKTDGTLWTWGLNTHGTLGNGNTVNYSSPVQVGALTDWKQFTCGYSIGAVKTDGTLWVWGDNTRGQLGLGNTVKYSSPVQVGSLTNWKQVWIGLFAGAAIKTDGTLWVWGRNDNGLLGLGNNVYYSSPVQVGSLTNWRYVSIQRTHALAIKTDGTLWSWGYSLNGGLGTGAGGFYSSPVQVGSDTKWKQITTNNEGSAAIKTDGTAWVWGYNIFSGQLGLGDTSNRYSPTQLGSLTTWKQIHLGITSSAAIQSPDLP